MKFVLGAAFLSLWLVLGLQVSAHAGNSCSADTPAGSAIGSPRAEATVGRCASRTFVSRNGRKGVNALKRLSRTQTSSSMPGRASGGMQYCVRLSDGYFFPTPHSQFKPEIDHQTTLDACSHICGAAEMAIYSLADPGLETEAMTSVSDGKPYLDLPSAFRFRSDAGFKGCDMQRYFRRIREAQSRAVTPFNLKGVSIPIPEQKPQIVAELTTIQTSGQKLSPSLPVRRVGPAYFPTN